MLVNILESRLYSILETISFFFLLNVLWLIMCIPIITIFPATAAMFGVIRQWVMKEDTAIFKPFFRFFAENFKHSFLFQIIMLVMIYVLYVDFNIIRTFYSTLQYLFMGALFLIISLGLLTSMYMFPMMVHYKLTFWQLVKNSFFFALKYFPTTIISILLFVLMFIILFYVPVTFLFIFSIFAYLIFRICFSRFRKEEELVKKLQEGKQN